MSEARPISERELLIDDGMRAEFRTEIDPLINIALGARGYTEDHSSLGQIYLDKSGVIASDAYMQYFGKKPFHRLKVSTTHDVFGTERNLTKAQLELNRIGGLGKSRFIKDGPRYSIETIGAGEQSSGEVPIAISDYESGRILEDIRAYTELGYSGSDITPSFDDTIEELEALSPTRTVDKRAHYQLLTSPEHGDIQMNLGESFELKYVQSGNRLKKYRTNIKKLFELVARQPLENGSLLLGAYYSSGKNGIEMKLTTEIVNTNYSNEQKQAFYDEVINTHQEKDIRKFGQGIINNIQKVIDENSDILRLG